MICRARFKSRYVMAVYCVFMRLALLPRVGMIIKNSKSVEQCLLSNQRHRQTPLQ